MRRISSFRDFQKQINSVIADKEIGSYIATRTGHLSNLMQTSSGRDKILGCLQYGFMIYTECMRHSDELWTEEMFSVEVSQSIVDNVSSSRRIFRFFKFFDAFKKINGVLKSQKGLVMKALILVNKVLFFLFYFSDNLVWLSSVGVVRREQETKDKWNTIRYFLCLLKNATGLLISICQILMYYKQGAEILSYFDEDNVKNTLITEQEEEIVGLMRTLILIRRKKRYALLNCSLSVFRMLMLLNKLQFPWFGRLLHPIFTAVCGFVSNLISAFKLLKEKKRFIRLVKKSKNDMSNQ